MCTTTWDHHVSLKLPVKTMASASLGVSILEVTHPLWRLIQLPVQWTASFANVHLNFMVLGVSKVSTGISCTALVSTRSISAAIDSSVKAVQFDSSFYVEYDSYNFPL